MPDSTVVDSVNHDQLMDTFPVDAVIINDGDSLGCIHLRHRPAPLPPVPEHFLPVVCLLLLLLGAALLCARGLGCNRVQRCRGAAHYQPVICLAWIRTCFGHRTLLLGTSTGVFG